MAAAAAAAAVARLCVVRSKVRTSPSLGRSLHNEPWTSLWRSEGVGPSCRLGTWGCSQRPGRRASGARAYLGAPPVLCARPCRPAPADGVRPKAVDENTEEFRLVYRFPGIKYCRVLSRMKLLQTAITTVMLPPVCYLYLHDQVSQTILLYTAGIAFFAGGMLYGMSYFFRRIIGLIYLNETGSTVKVAHLTFWGRRKDILCPTEMVMTLGDVGDGKEELLLQFKRVELFLMASKLF
ncbi:transmembrane protein 186 isoform X2 [Struthio camelus]|uniref:transmembrane protein 186 isoform X2 n=1 Tax=Struthio camelus TaxID=8801 RepID=UPI0036040DF4